MKRATERPVVLGTGLALLLLLLAAPRPAEALATLRAPGAAADPTEPVVALVALCAWLLAGWLAATLVLTLLARAPGLLGRLAARLGRRVAPVAVRRALEVALGLTVTAGVLGAGPAAAGTHHPADGAPSTATTAEQAEPPLSLDWGGTSAAPDLDWPAGQAPAEPSPSAAPTSGPADVRAAPVLSPGPPGSDAVVVRPGDSLWKLAADDLERRQGSAPSAARTAAAWPAWWAANREAVGDDPDVIHPGTALRPPAEQPGSAESPDA